MNIVIIGAGQAAAQSAISLRQQGFDGSIQVVGEEASPPYQRPPLSKAYMKGELEEERLYLRPAEWYEANQVELLLSCRAEEIDRHEKNVKLQDGESLHYDRLVIATGSSPRTLAVPGAELAGIFDLRTLNDVEQIRPNLTSGKKMIIVGAGYIGLEAAAVACQLGLDVTVVEMESRVLARVTSSVMSKFYEDFHTAAGVHILTNARLASFTGQKGQVTTVVLADGTGLDADIVLVGIGILPNEDLATNAGIDCDNGIIVDRDGRTSDPDIYACGDCTRRPLVHYSGAARLESVHNAIEQGKLVAAAILDRPRPREECPWFWSDQFDLKLQIAGLSSGFDDYVVRGEMDEKKFSVFYFKDQSLIAVDSVNAPGDFLQVKKWIAAGQSPDRAQLADHSMTLKEISASL